LKEEGKRPERFDLTFSLFNFEGAPGGGPAEGGVPFWREPLKEEG